MVQDGLTTVLRWDRLGIRYQHELLFVTIGNFFDMPKIFRPLTMLLAKPHKLSQRSYDGTKCPHEWRDSVTIRIEFDFVLLRVSILSQYQDSVTPALRWSYALLTQRAFRHNETSVQAKLKVIKRLFSFLLCLCYVYTS